MAAQRTLVVRRISTGSIFRILAAGIFPSMVPFTLLISVLALLGFDTITITWNQVPVTGLYGLVAAPFIGAFAAAFFTAIGGAAVAFGLWLFSKFRPLRIQIEEDNAAE